MYRERGEIQEASTEMKRTARRSPSGLFQPADHAHRKEEMPRIVFHASVFTPKALHFKAQGQRRSRATLGIGFQNHLYAKGVRQKLCITPSA